MKTWHWILIIIGILILLYIWKKGKDMQNKNSTSGNLGGGNIGGSVGTEPGDLDPQVG